MGDVFIDRQQREDLRKFLLAICDCMVSWKEFEKAHGFLLQLSPQMVGLFFRHEREDPQTFDRKWFRGYLQSLHYGDLSGTERWKQLLFFACQYAPEMYRMLKKFSPFAEKKMLFVVRYTENGLSHITWVGDNSDLLELGAEQEKDGEYIIIINPKSVVPVKRK